MFLVFSITIIMASIVHDSTAVNLHQLQDVISTQSSTNVDQPRTLFLDSRLSGLKESPSSEYVFWILFFGIIQRELPHNYGRVGFNFANEIYKVATNDQDNNSTNVSLYDRIFGFNGTSKNITWKNINLNLTDYGVVLDSVVNMFEEAVTLGSVRTQEIQALARIGQSVANFWSRINSDTMESHEQSKWRIIVAGLTKLIGRGTGHSSPNKIILYENSVHQGECKLKLNVLCINYK